MLKECKYIPRLETERLVLRQLQPEDAEDPGKWFQNTVITISGFNQGGSGGIRRESGQRRMMDISRAI